MSDLRETLRSMWRSASRPLPAALVFCTAGLVCAVFAVGLNRMISMTRPPLVVSVAPSHPPSANPSPASAQATPSSTAASCQDAPAPRGNNLGSLVTAADATVQLTAGDSTLSVVIPAGAQISGHAGDVQAQTASPAGPSQAVHGTLVQDASICATGRSGMVQIAVQAGATVDGSAVPSSGGIAAVDIHFTTGGD
jgi:hypothetical protein